MSARRRAGEFVLVSAFAAVVAALGGGGVEAMADSTGVLHGAASLGFLTFLAAPVGFALSALGRLLVRAWRPDELVAATRDPETGGSPRLAAWGVYLLLAAFLLAAVVLQGMNRVVVLSSARVVYVLAAPILAVGGAVILAMLSRPAVLGLSHLLVAVDRRLAARRGRSLFRPRIIAAGFAATGVLFLAGAWFVVIQPEIGHFDLSYVPTVALWLGLLALAPLGWAALGRRRRARTSALAATGGALVLVVGAALFLRLERPFDMLEIWGDSRLSGFAIDTLYDIEGLRGELDLAGFRPAERPGEPHNDIVLVTIDTVRADRTPPYGGGAAMPALGRIAKEGVVFQWTFSAGNVTRRSVPAMVMGLSSPRLRGRVTGWALKLDPRHVLVAERLRAAGYQTAGFFCCTSQFGPEHRLGLIRGIEHLAIEKEGEDLAQQAATWLRARRASGERRPLFLWMHLIEPHGWENSHPASAEARRRTQRYDLSLADADRALGTLLDEVWRDGGRAHAYVVVTSDHGEALGDHGHKTHAESLYNSEIRVPFVIAGPGIQPRRVARPVGGADLAPTLIDLAGFVPPGMPEMDGVSVAPAARGKGELDVESGSAYSAMIRDRSVDGDARAVIEGHWKLISGGGRVELFDFVSDPSETRDLSRSQPEITARLKVQLTKRREIDALDPF